MATIITLGIDVCKERLDCHIYPLNIAFNVPNTEVGWKQLIEQLTPHSILSVAMEATGGLERSVAQHLRNHGYTVSVINPRRIHAYRNILGTRAKNDRLDAELIANFAAWEHTQPKQKTACPPVHAELHELASRREQLCSQTADNKKRLQQKDSALVKESLARSIAADSREMRLIEAAMAKIIKKDPALHNAQRLLLSIPGIGTLSAMIILAWLPELGHLSHKKIASLVGVAPHICQSGAMQGNARIYGGRKRLRQKLYMTAHNAIRYNPILKAYAERLALKHKDYKHILIATLNKLLHFMNAIIKNNAPWIQIP